MGSSSFNIYNSFLKQDEATRLYRDFPKLEQGPEKYCPTCGKLGTYYWWEVDDRGEPKKDGEKRNRPCECDKQLQLHKHYLVAGIGVTYQRLTWSDYEGDSTIQDALKLYYENHANFVSRGIGLIIGGPYGAGKTMLTNLLLKDLVKLGYRCYSTTFAATIDSFTAGWRSTEEKRYFREKFVNSDVLLLDDLGREFKGSTSLSETTFDNILRQRVQGGRPTFITTNMSLSDLEDGYGGAVISLLREVSLEHTFEDQSEDFRVKSQKRTLSEVLRGEVRPIV